MYKSKLYKKSQSVGRYVILSLIILLVVLVVWLIISRQATDVMVVYFNKIFRT